MYGTVPSGGYLSAACGFHHCVVFKQVYPSGLPDLPIVITNQPPIMKEYKTALLTTSLLLGAFNAQGQVLVANFGTATDSFSKGNSTERNYSFSAGTDTADLFVSEGSNYAQINWDLANPVDLSSVIATKGITVFGDFTAVSGSPTFRIYLYDNSDTFATADTSTPFSGSFTFTSFNVFATDGFSRQSTGTMDWSNVVKIGFRNQGGSSTIGLSIDEVAVVPEPATYALLLGALSLGAMLIRRRR